MVKSVATNFSLPEKIGLGNLPGPIGFMQDVYQKT